MTLVTARTTEWRCSQWPRAAEPIKVPAGLRVKPCNDGTGQFWVDEFGWLSPFYRHDAEHYGIRIDPEDTRDCE